jgi:hypothetical protein
MSEIKAIKLVTGEELVVEITSNEDELVTFKNPVATVMQRRQEGPVLGFMPWMQASNGPFTISKKSTIVICDVAEEVKNGYNQIFGAGIVVPPKDLILG